MKWVLFSLLVIAALAVIVTSIGALLPKAHVATRTARLNHTPEAAWSLIAGDQSWRPSVRKYELLPQRHGVKVWNEVDKHGQTIMFETVESKPPARLVNRIASPNLPFGGTWTYEISPVESGCAVTITERGEIYNPIFCFVAHFVLGYTATMDEYLKALEHKLEEWAHANGAKV